MDVELATRLLDYVRRVTRDEAASYAEPPTALAGGYETRTYALRLRTTADGWAGPLVVRVLPAFAAAPWLAREDATLRWLEHEGYPVPHVDRKSVV